MGLGRWNFFNKRRTVHEAAQRAWCRLAFLMLAALPVCVALSACLLEYVPLYQQYRASRYAQQLMQITGLVVKVQRVELLSPSQRRLHGIELAHPETGEPLGRITALWISETANGCAIRAHWPQLEADRLKDLVEVIHQQVLCRPTNRLHAVVMSLDGLSLIGAPEKQFEFKHFHCELRRSPTTTSARCAFEQAGIAGDAAELTFTRQHNDTLPTSQLTFNTAGQFIPGHWVNHFAPQFAVPGADAILRDSHFAAEFNQLSWSLRGRCRMQRVDTSNWFDRPVLLGNADIEITDFAMTDSHLRVAKGALLVQNGQVHPELVDAAAFLAVYATEQAGKDLASQLVSNPANPFLPFTKMGCEFTLDGNGLTIVPRMRQAAIAIDDAGILLQYCEKPSVALTPSNVVAFLALTPPKPSSKRSDLLQSPTVKRLVKWLPGPQSPEARTARAFNN